MKTMYAAVLEKYGQFKWKEIAYPDMGNDAVFVAVTNTFLGANFTRGHPFLLFQDMNL